MALLDEILSWTESLPLWQRDATRRLFLNQNNLSSDDEQELYLLFKKEHQLIEDENLNASPLTNAHLPATTEQGTGVALNQLKDLQHVNKLVPNQKLDFSGNGITVFYGDNGAGKSGYARVIKSACRARGAAEAILPDATDQNAVHQVPQAVFVVTTNGVREELSWTQGSPSPELLSQISVFDSNCARAYLTKEQDVAYLPYGLDIVERLANQVIPAIQAKWNAEINNIDTDVRPYDALKGTSKVGELIKELSASTDEAKLKKLASITEWDEARLTEIKGLLNETNPLEVANTHLVTASRFKNLAIRLEEPLNWIKESAVSKFKNLKQDTLVSQNAQAQVFNALSGNESLIQGTGGEIWKTLFEAARNFALSTEPQTAFPNQQIGDACLLCQQPLSPEAIDRLGRFEQFIKNDVAVRSDQTQEKLAKAISKISNANLQMNLDDATRSELALADETLLNRVKAFQDSIEQKRGWMLNAERQQNWENPPRLAESPRTQLRSIAAFHLRRARILKKSADQRERNLLEIEKAELEAKEGLKSVIDPIVELVKGMKLKAALENCRQAFDTRSISTQSKKFANDAVTAGLGQALDREFSKLGVGHIKTKLKPSSRQGVIYHQLILDLPISQKLEKVLSEGEQRAIAIASFMAELSLSNHASGIVIDDPVSSLDHKKRKYVAARLVEEAVHRQVLVFTHEIVFLNQLEEQSKKRGIGFNCSFLEHQGDRAGHISEGLPWKHKSVKNRLDDLNKIQREFSRRPWPDNPSESDESDIVRQYSFFRSTIERYVQDIFLGGIVQRFRDYIDVSKIEKVIGTQQDEVNELMRLMKVCHDVVEAHDPSSARNDPAPTPDEFKVELEAFQLLMDKVKQRRSDFRAG